MRIRSWVAELPSEVVGAHLQGLPEAEGYDVRVKHLRYRDRPHLSAWTDFDERSITLQVPEPFLPFGEVVPYGAKRRPGKGMKFVWLSEGVTFRDPGEVLRFLYCHEWMHWFLKERLGRKSSAETTCDRFALYNYAKLVVTEADATAALRRT
jgi:hypothetical protein